MNSADELDYMDLPICCCDLITLLVEGDGCLIPECILNCLTHWPLSSAYKILLSYCMLHLRSCSVLESALLSALGQCDYRFDLFFSFSFPVIF